jgi:alkylation response protein AidB-like acyl-CoA dehydrogenase
MNTKPKTDALQRDWVARARDIAPMIEAASDRTEAEGKVPKDIMDAMHDAELFRMCLPESLGGGAASPLEMTQVCETIAGADASTGWCLGQALGCTMAAGYVAHEVAQDIFGPKDAVLAWGPPGKAQAVPVDGGYMSTGQWRFGSGSRNATWLGGHSPVVDADGNRVMNDNGSPKMRTMLFKKSEAEMIDVWQVIGLKGTGSDNYKTENLFVPEAYTTWRDSQPDRVEQGPFYSIPLLTCYGMAFSGLTLGIARSMMESFKELAVDKVGGGMTTVLRENAVIQSNVAECEAKILSSRAFLVEMLEEYWDCLCAGDEPSFDVRARLRLSITYAMNQAREAATYAYHAAGTNAIFESNPFERRFRDIYTVSQQGQGHKSNYEPVGQVFMGLPPSGHRV